MHTITETELKKNTLIFLNSVVELMKEMKTPPFDIKEFIAVLFYIEEQKQLGVSIDRMHKIIVNKVKMSSESIMLLNYNMNLLDDCKTYQDYLKEYEE